MGRGLVRGAHGRGGPVTKTGAYPPDEPAGNRHNGALLTPGGRDPIEDRGECGVAGQRPPGEFDEHMA